MICPRELKLNWVPQSRSLFPFPQSPGERVHFVSLVSLCLSLFSPPPSSKSVGFFFQIITPEFEVACSLQVGARPLHPRRYQTITPESWMWNTVMRWISHARRQAALFLQSSFKNFVLFKFILESGRNTDLLHESGNLQNGQTWSWDTLGQVLLENQHIEIADNTLKFSMDNFLKRTNERTNCTFWSTKCVWRKFLNLYLVNEIPLGWELHIRTLGHPFPEV